MTAVPPPLRFALVALGAFVLHSAVFTQFRVFGVMPEILLLLLGAAAVRGEPERAAMVGIVLGLAQDLLIETPFGMSALAFAVVGYAVASVQFPLSRVTWWIPVAVTAFVTAAAMASYLVFGWIFGQESLFGMPLLRPIALASGFNALLSWPAFQLMHWALDDGHFGHHSITGRLEHGRLR